jgi:hypothetical protein
VKLPASGPKCSDEPVHLPSIRARLGISYCRSCSFADALKFRHESAFAVSWTASARVDLPPSALTDLIRKAGKLRRESHLKRHDREQRRPDFVPVAAPSRCQPQTHLPRLGRGTLPRTLQPTRIIVQIQGGEPHHESEQQVLIGFSATWRSCGTSARNFRARVGAHSAAPQLDRSHSSVGSSGCRGTRALRHLFLSAREHNLRRPKQQKQKQRQQP